MRPIKEKPKNVAELPLPEVDARTVEKIAAKADYVKPDHAYRSLDPGESRNFMSTTMPFNEYEHTVLNAAAEKAGYKSVKQFMRDAYLDKALKILEGIE